MMVRREREYKLELMIPFCPIRKRMTVAYVLPGDEKVRVVVKGAPEEIAGLCLYELNAENKDGYFKNHPNGKVYLSKVISEEMAMRGQKPISYAYRDFDVDEFNLLK